MKKGWGIAALAVWCLLFLRCETTEKSMIRALYLEQQAAEWSVALVYQAPDAAADAAEASGALRLAAASGQSLEQALAAAERQLPCQADYRLCDYLIFPQQASSAQLAAYEQLVQRRQCGRTAAGMVCTGFAFQELCSANEENEAFPNELLDQCKQCAVLQPCLYEQAEPTVLPLLQLEENKPSLAETGVLRAGETVQPLDAAQTEMVFLLTGKAGQRSFWLDGQLVQIRRCSVSAALQNKEVLLRLDCQKAYGMLQPTEAQCLQLQTLCMQTVQALWEQGVDLLHLQQTAQLHYGGEQAAFAPTKNACPQLRADVQFLLF